MFTFQYGSDRFAGRRRVGVKFDRHELKELGIAMGVITLVFAARFSGNFLWGGSFSPLAFIVVLPIAFVATFTGFLLHELAHKISANHYGYPAAFSYDKRYLLYGALITIVLGILFVAPGAVFVYGRPTRKENGIISAAGPVTNLVIGFTSLGAAIGLSQFIGFLGFGLFYVGIINLIIGAFNMIPVMPLDGSKVWKWNRPVYIIMASLFLVPIILYITGLLWKLVI
jgi:Zn-dependent protease